jgi:hypothetical protein
MVVSLVHRNLQGLWMVIIHTFHTLTIIIVVVIVSVKFRTFLSVSFFYKMGSSFQGNFRRHFPFYSSEAIVISSLNILSFENISENIFFCHLLTLRSKFILTERQ